MKILTETWEFFKTLNFIDIIFFFAVVILLVLIVTLIYFIKINNEEGKNENIEETAEMKIVKEIKNNMKNEEPTIQFTDYEKDQEDKAIISYELNYETEELYDDLSVKKVNLDDLVNRKVEANPNVSVRVISFAKEEAFLEALKRLQKELG